MTKIEERIMCHLDVFVKRYLVLEMYRLNILSGI